MKRLCILLVLSSIVWALPALGQERLVVAYSTTSGGTVPLWVSKESGAFARHGLNVELIYIEGGTRTIQAMLAGDAPITLAAGPEVVHAILKGAKIVSIGAINHTYPYLIVAAKGITKPEQLKGKKMAVSQFGASSHFATLRALERWGLEPGKDVAIIQMGNTPARLAALMAGTVEAAAIGSGSQGFAVRKSGLNILADLSDLGIEYLGTSLNVTRQFLADRPELVRRFMKAVVEGIHFLKTRKEESKAIVGRHLRTTDPEMLEDWYQESAQKRIRTKPYPTAEGIKTVLREIADSEPKAKDAKPEQFIDPSFVRELDESGYIDKLYK